MSRKLVTLADIQGSRDFQALNPHLSGLIRGPIPGASSLAVTTDGEKGPSTAPGSFTGKKRKEMNKTERSYSNLLKSMVLRGEITSWEYEGMTLRTEGKICIKFTPDFVHFVINEDRTGAGLPSSVQITFIEVKGPHIWPKDLLKFKQFKNYYPHFGFELHQLIKGQWQRLL